MKRKIIRIIIFISISSIIGCTANKTGWPPKEWPANVVSNLWIPPNVKTLRCDPQQLYMAIFTADVCYPAKNLIADMVNTMNSRGWERLNYDPLNPQVTAALNHVRGIGGEWGSGLGKDMLEIYDWRELWRDKQGNIIEYRLEYKLSREEKIENKCVLSGFSMYTTADLFKAILKAVQEKRTRQPN
jgi:hypothetical protein